LGDVVVALETVCREAEAAHKPVGDHLAHLLVHGILHLLGHDHQNEVEAERMERLERDMLQRLGLPDPYTATA
jgi:probable rRNA maturation factor